MYKFAIISNGTVTNIIESNDYDNINILKQYNEDVVLANNQDIDIGYLWDGSTFSKDPVLAEKERLSVERQTAEMYEQKLSAYNELMSSTSLTAEERTTLEMLKASLNK